MSEEITLEDYKKGYREIAADEEKKGFLIHLSIYVIVNVIIAIPILINAPEAWWAVFVIPGFWGIGLMIHYLNSVRWIEKGLKEREAKAEYRAREPKRNNVSLKKEER